MRIWLWHCTSGWRLAGLTLGTEVAERPGARLAVGDGDEDEVVDVGEGVGEGGGDGEPGPHWVW